MLSTIDSYFRHVALKNTIFFILSVALMATPCKLQAQDKIYKTDNTIVEAVVIKISDTQVDYKKFSNQNGPVYSLSTKAVSMIVYQNGEKETFNQPAIEEKRVANTIMPLKFGIISQENARSLVLTENFNSAIGVYAQLVLKDTTNILLNSEYAYALALGGIYDAALARLDRIWYTKGDNKVPDFFASQVYALMGFSDLSREFKNGQNPPAWISSLAPQLLQKHKRSVRQSNDRSILVGEFKKANRLTAQSYYLQAIGRFAEITTMFPDEYLPYVGYSIALEKAGLIEKSSAAIVTAINNLGDNTENLETKQVLEQRLVTLKNTTVLSGNTGTPAENSKVQMMLYAGGQIASSYTSLNGKFGIFMSKSSYTTIDAGFSAVSGSSAATLGFTVYQRGKIMAGGVGLSASFGSSTTMFFKVSLGPSIMNKSGTASWDIFLDGRTAISKGSNATTMGISIGRSIYFGKRK